MRRTGTGPWGAESPAGPYNNRRRTGTALRPEGATHFALNPRGATMSYESGDIKDETGMLLGKLEKRGDRKVVTDAGNRYLGEYNERNNTTRGPSGSIIGSGDQ